jgi:hypothetical protein
MQVIIDMTQRSPEKRTNVRNYRHILEGRRSPSTMVSQGGSSHAGQRAPPSADTDAAVTRDSTESMPFPEYFSQTIYPLFSKLHTMGVTPDDRIVILCEVCILIS